MNKYPLILTARFALASAYLLQIPIYLTVFPPRLGLLAYLGYCGSYSLLAFAAAASLIWFGRHTPLVCVILPVLKIIESFGALFSISESLPRWHLARGLMFPLIWTAITIFLYSSLKAALANRMNLQQSVPGYPPQGVGSPEQ